MNNTTDNRQAPFGEAQWVNQYARLPNAFYARLKPSPVNNPGLIKLNRALAQSLGLDWRALESDAGVAVLAGNAVPDGADPLAQAYAGHQFGYFNPQLGDGRAILLGEIRDPHGQTWDIQLKGSGPTPFSRRGDGRAAIGPVVREYLVSEAMHHLGIKTTRALAAVTSGESVFRDGPLPGAILTRVASSHVRVGTFEFFRARGQQPAIRQLADFVIARHYPDLQSADNPYLALLETVIEAQAQLVSAWMCVGFIHGVMNTDNTSLSGETIDYGPCAFMDFYDPATVFSAIDTQGRYAFASQGNIALWNLSRLAECWLFLFDEDRNRAIGQAETALEAFSERFNHLWFQGMRRKLGLLERDEADDHQLLQELLRLMQKGGVDYTRSFRLLGHSLVDEAAKPTLMAMFAEQRAPMQIWYQQWRQRLTLEPHDTTAIAASMRAANPVYIPRNHLVEEVIQAAQVGDYQPLEGLLERLQRPFEEQPASDRFAMPPEPQEVVRQTFCGT